MALRHHSCTHSRQPINLPLIPLYHQSTTSSFTSHLYTSTNLLDRLPTHLANLSPTPPTTPKHLANASTQPPPASLFLRSHTLPQPSSFTSHLHASKQIANLPIHPKPTSPSLPTILPSSRHPPYANQPTLLMNHTPLSPIALPPTTPSIHFANPLLSLPSYTAPTPSTIQIETNSTHRILATTKTPLHSHIHHHTPTDAFPSPTSRLMPIAANALLPTPSASQIPPSIHLPQPFRQRTTFFFLSPLSFT